MPHGTPDWGLVGPKATTYGLDDLGEHAVRLGSPHLWDRRGDVIFQTTFQDGLGEFYLAIDGAGAAVQLWTHETRQGPYKVKLIGGTTLLRYAQLSKVLPYPTLLGIGLEYTFSVSVNFEACWWAFSLYDGTDHHDPIVRYDYANRRLEYQDHLGAWIVFASPVNVMVWDYPANTGKLVVDTVNDLYVRFMFNDVTYPLTNIPYRVVGSGIPPIWQAGIRVVSLAIANGYGFIDNVIITQNEP